MPTATASTPTTPLVRAFLDRVFGRRSAPVPGLHDATDWLGVRRAATHPPEREDFFTLASLNYVCGVALFFESGDPRYRPACTLAHVAATVSLVNHNGVLTALAAEPAAAHLVLPLLHARTAGAHQQVAGIMPGARDLVANWHGQVDAITRQRVLAYFASIA